MNCLLIVSPCPEIGWDTFSESVTHNRKAGGTRLCVASIKRSASSRHQGLHSCDRNNYPRNIANGSPVFDVFSILGFYASSALHTNIGYSSEQYEWPSPVRVPRSEHRVHEYEPSIDPLRVWRNKRQVSRLLEAKKRHQPHEDQIWSQKVYKWRHNTCLSIGYRSQNLVQHMPSNEEGLF